MEPFLNILFVIFLFIWVFGGVITFIGHEDRAKENNKMRRLLIFSGPIVWAGLVIGYFIKKTEKFFNWWTVAFGDYWEPTNSVLLKSICEDSLIYWVNSSLIQVVARTTIKTFTFLSERCSGNLLIAPIFPLVGYNNFQ